MIHPSAGELRELVDIIEVRPPYNAATGAGTAAETYAAAVWAKIEPLGGGIEAETMQEKICRQQYRIWIRYRDGITPFQQLEWKGMRLVIDGPPEKMDQWLLLHAYSTTTRNF